MRLRILHVLLACAAAIGPASADAIGFGPTTSTGALGQPLDFSATVRLAADETLERKCVSATVRAGESTLGPDQVRVALRPASDPGERLVRVTTARPLDEPVVTIDIALGCGAGVARSFVAFLDPPQLQLARAGEAAGERASDRPVDATSSSAIALAPRSDAKPAAQRARPHASTPARRAVGMRPVIVASSTPHARRSTRATGSDIGARTPSGPRLRLDAPVALARAPESAASAIVAGTPVLASASVASAANTAADAAASAADAERARLSGELAQAHARIQELESGLARLRSDGQALRQSMGALQARLNAPQPATGSDRLVMLLGITCVLLTSIVAALSARRVGPVRRWWEPTRAAAAAETVPVPQEAPQVALVETPADAPFKYERPALEARPSMPPEPASTGLGGLEVTTVIDHELLARVAAGEGEWPASPVDAAPIDLLIGLEQQAEGFLILGQEERAIEVLTSHLAGPAGDSPLPYLRLLALHRRRGDRATHVRVAEALQQRLGGELASWSDLDAGDPEGLSSHAAEIERLQRLWAWPAEAMRAIEGWLFRGLMGDERFSLDAYADLMLLHGLARERVEADTGVDVLLPIEDLQPVHVEFAPPAFRFSRFGAVDVPLRPALDLDVSGPGTLDSRPSELRQAI